MTTYQREAINYAIAKAAEKTNDGAVLRALGKVKAAVAKAN